jgi:hypothetical protein
MSTAVDITLKTLPNVAAGPCDSAHIRVLTDTPEHMEKHQEPDKDNGTDTIQHESEADIACADISRTSTPIINTSIDSSTHTEPLVSADEQHDRSRRATKTPDPVTDTRSYLSVALQTRNRSESALPSHTHAADKLSVAKSRQSMDGDERMSMYRPRFESNRDISSITGNMSMQALVNDLRTSDSFESLSSRPSSSTTCSAQPDSERARILTYGEFRGMDTRPRKNRRQLAELLMLDRALRAENKIREQNKGRLRPRKSK